MNKLFRERAKLIVKAYRQGVFGRVSLFCKLAEEYKWHFNGWPRRVIYQLDQDFRKGR